MSNRKSKEKPTRVGIVYKGGLYGGQTVHEEPISGGIIVDDPTTLDDKGWMNRIEARLNEIESDAERADYFLPIFKDAIRTKEDVEHISRAVLRIETRRLQELADRSPGY